MIKYFKILIIFILFSGCNSEVPTQFSEAALNDVFTTLDGSSIKLRDILKLHEDKTILIDVWASWCGDCIKGMPDVKALQEAYGDVAYVFLSLDRTERAWKKGIKKYDVRGEHYYMPSGKKSAFGSFVKIDWIPRYMVVDSKGHIKLFKAVEADDINIKKRLIN
ncbi:TlpA family protein disulfide reductase [Mariniflexile ostreae]|uniref:TlpA family protein disulfide reductase n=1 Tax=Mariniflexile ostreae TaxID=1520892 RepID=A0ABV5F7B1_9FLAO